MKRTVQWRTTDAYKFVIKVYYYYCVPIISVRTHVNLTDDLNRTEQRGLLTNGNMNNLMRQRLYNDTTNNNRIYTFTTKKRLFQMVIAAYNLIYIVPVGLHY